MSRPMPYLLIAITIVVFVPLILLCYKHHKPTIPYYILGFINMGIALHVLTTVDKANASPDPQAGMGLGLYIMVALAAFVLLTLAGIGLFAYQMKSR